MIFIQTLPYFLVLLLVYLLSSRLPVTKAKPAIIIILTIFVGFRYAVGWDYYTYYDAIKYNYGLDRYAFLIRMIANFCVYLDSPQLFFLITGFFSMLFCVSAIYKISTKPAISLLIFITFPLLFLDSLIIVRYFLSFSIIFYASLFLKENKVFSYLFFILIASQIHIASLIGILYLIPYYMNINNKASLLLFVLSFVIGNAILHIFPSIIILFSGFSSLESDVNLFNRYLEAANNANLKAIPILYYTINAINLLFKNKLFYRDDKDVILYLSVMNIGCCIMQLFSFENSMAARFSVPFIVYLVLIVDRYKNKSLSQFIFISLGLLLFVYALTIDAHHSEFIGRRNCFLPYNFNFFNL